MLVFGLIVLLSGCRKQRNLQKDARWCFCSTSSCLAGSSASFVAYTCTTIEAACLGLGLLMPAGRGVPSELVDSLTGVHIAAHQSREVMVSSRAAASPEHTRTGHPPARDRLTT